MLKNEKEWERFRDLTGIMENTSPMQPSKGFTAKIMARLPEEKVPRRQLLLKQLFGNSAFPTNLNIGFSNPVTKTECSFYFLLTGFFYLVLGLILMLGLYLSGGPRYPEWLTIQPLIGLLLAVELIALGIIVYTNGESAVRFARGGVFIYAILIILNGLIGTLYIRIPIAVFSAAIFSITGLGITILLRMAVDRYYPENVFSEVR
ncbi:MAG: hypothetical protein APR62_11730 [Smithella sp. SDB]|nr:MAG: hypothetical protein APR62_11730 [Smithella sp. SDB]